MNQTLPVHLNFAQKAKIGFEIQGKLPIKQLKRLSESLLSNDGDLTVELKFDRIGPVPFIVGHITAQLELKCQRCMQSMAHPVDLHFKLGMVQKEEQIEKLPEDMEPYLIETDNNHLPDMLEEELLLALPLVAMHEFDCSDYLQKQVLEQQDEVEKPEEKENPFSVLKDLL
ncbi:MAG: metal-binding protein [endosymbiont of Galathealinum brachiosum]|uniref:Large ribosomal RNA subunit accumulation protein YceD n=1 Tax=endosymbiont of Galathealinum brachiosum TaxID=2200906 RepID=A0A370DHT8_9GAMM|nr:MAG: metal-binding protein [endosymbiont of Galathealinum brachiosum]